MKNPDALFGRLGNRMFQATYIYAQWKRGDLDDIYIQDYRHFKEFEKELQQWFGEGVGYLPYVAIHLRVGKNPTIPDEPNYIDNPFYVSLPKTGYYIDAINLFPNRKFLVFSDDIAFAKTYFEGDKFAFDDSANEIDAFNRIASCDSLIIANSSFSYMAALVAPNPSKIVVAPTYDKWYSDGSKTRTIIPPTWKQI